MRETLKNLHSLNSFETKRIIAVVVVFGHTFSRLLSRNFFIYFLHSEGYYYYLLWGKRLKSYADAHNSILLPLTIDCWLCTNVTTMTDYCVIKCKMDFRGLKPLEILTFWNVGWVRKFLEEFEETFSHFWWIF